jgi:hypothetical protein
MNKEPTPHPSLRQLLKSNTTKLERIGWRLDPVISDDEGRVWRHELYWVAANPGERLT